MANVPRPSSTEEMVEQLWYAIIGTNGEGALQQIKCNREGIERIEELFGKYITEQRPRTCYYLQAVEQGKARKASKREDKRLRITLLALIPAYVAAGFGVYEFIANVLLSIK